VALFIALDFAKTGGKREKNHAFRSGAGGAEIRFKVDWWKEWKPEDHRLVNYFTKFLAHPDFPDIF
jgi:hypothetical protein